MWPIFVGCPYHSPGLLELCMASLNTKFLCISVFILFFFTKGTKVIHNFRVLQMYFLMSGDSSFHLSSFISVFILLSQLCRISFWEVANVCIITRMCSSLLGALKMCTCLWGSYVGATCFISYVVLRNLLTQKVYNWPSKVLLPHCWLVAIRACLPTISCDIGVIALSAWTE